jgi:hypothetical protein
MLIGKCLLTLWRTLVPPSKKTKLLPRNVLQRVKVWVMQLMWCASSSSGAV